MEAFVKLMSHELIKRRPRFTRRPLLSRDERYELAKAQAEMTFYFAYYLTPARIPAILR